MKGFKIKGSKQYMGNMINSAVKRLFWGLGAAILTYVVVPKMRRMARPVVEKGVSNVKELAERGKQTIEEYKASKQESIDMIKDAVAKHTEAQGETLSDMLSDRINALQETIDRLKKEIMELKDLK